MNILIEKNIEYKLSNIESVVHQVLSGKIFEVPEKPGRSFDIVQACDLPPKKGILSPEGQGRLLHDLASIELQAMELALRSLIEYPEAPAEFREELAKLVLSEASHLRLCLGGIQNLGFKWGSWSTHLALWNAVKSEDTLLDRLLIVHRYLEGSGLDAGEKFEARLKGVPQAPIHNIVNTIKVEEVGHVQFGNHWYAEVCKQQKLDPDHDFKTRFKKICYRLPRRLEVISDKIRLEAGFTQSEIDFLKQEQKLTM